MKFSTDIILKRKCWSKMETLLEQKIFSRQVDIFILACSIGICEDKFLSDDPEDNMFEEKSIGRNTLNNNDDLNELLVYLYQNAVLNTKNIDLSVDERKQAAFDLDSEIKVADMSCQVLLTRFADYGMSILAEKVTDHPIETLDAIIELMDYYKNNIDLICDVDISIDVENL